LYFHALFWWRCVYDNYFCYYLEITCFSKICQSLFYLQIRVLLIDAIQHSKTIRCLLFCYSNISCEENCINLCSNWLIFLPKISLSPPNVKNVLMITHVNRYGYPHFHRNCTEYGRLRSDIVRKRIIFTRNIGHSNTAPYTRLYFHCIRPYTCRNLIIIGTYFCACYHGRIRFISAS